MVKIDEVVFITYLTEIYEDELRFGWAALRDTPTIGCGRKISC